MLKNMGSNARLTMFLIRKSQVHINRLLDIQEDEKKYIVCSSLTLCHLIARPMIIHSFFQLLIGQEMESILKQFTYYILKHLKKQKSIVMVCRFRKFLLHQIN